MESSYNTTALSPSTRSRLEEESHPLRPVQLAGSTCNLWARPTLGSCSYLSERRLKDQ